MNFRRFDPAQFPELMTWFPDAEQCRTWGGTEFRFPFTPESFRADSRIDDIASWTLVGDDNALAAFGQCYVRIKRCHFGRLAVSAKLRGSGLGTRLIRELTAWGLAEYGSRELSLFVNRNNVAAHRLYLRLGFREAIYPEPTPFMANSHYMIATALTPANSMTLSDVRREAMALLGTTESPHHQYTSFRVRGRIYATAPTEGGSLHIFLDEEDRDRMVKLYPATYEILGWGKKVVGLRVNLETARPDDVRGLLRTAWQRKLGKR